ncbi:MAG: UTP--glucose-1-phosphate uridylyltransferase [Bacteroidetes bacterium]|nr:UTP--glucose-1-phosphate uridylyltransferase [Bacteroidota bacterium]
MQHAVRKAVIPAAGFGTRLLPATKAQPKEMLVVVDKPVIQYVVEEAVQSGITDILIIISEGKEVLKDHFAKDEHLEELLTQKKKTAELKEIQALHQMANITYIYQAEQRGLGDAVLCAEAFVAGEPFALLLGDTIVESAEPLTGTLAKDYAEKKDAVVALQRVPMAVAHRYGVFVGEEVASKLYKAQRLVEKPPQGNIPSDMVFAGRYILTPEIFDALRRTPPGVNDEIQLTDAMKILMEQHAMYGRLFDGVRHDVGNKLDFIKTNIVLGLQRGDIGAELREWLKSLG